MKNIPPEIERLTKEISSLFKLIPGFALSLIVLCIFIGILFLWGKRIDNNVTTLRKDHEIQLTSLTTNVGELRQMINQFDTTAQLLKHLSLELNDKSQQLDIFRLERKTDSINNVIREYHQY